MVLLTPEQVRWKEQNDSKRHFRNAGAGWDRRDLGFHPPPAEDVPGLVNIACSVMQNGLEPPAIGAAWIHAALAAIHPFSDGNGRASRVVASLAMYRGGFKLPEFTSLEEWWGRHLSDYYAAFLCLGRTFDPAA